MDTWWRAHLLALSCILATRLMGQNAIGLKINI
jgi:hypothetical protein